MQIQIDVEGKGRSIGILDERNPETAEAFSRILPVEGEAIVWLEEVYFPIPLNADYENSSISADRGDISYWPPGNAICIFFGNSQPASEVNHIGKIRDNLKIFTRIEAGDIISIKRV